MFDKSTLFLTFVIAKFAFEGHLTRVRRLVALKAIVVFAARFAKVAIEFFMSVSFIFVHFQLFFLLACEFAVRTLQGRLLGVLDLMPV